MDTRHPQSIFSSELEKLKALVLELGNKSLEQLNSALIVWQEKDEVLAEQVVAQDEKINELERQVDKASLMLVTKMVPKAGDLRFILASGKIASELERIADYSKTIAGRSKRCFSESFTIKTTYICRMVNVLIPMLENILIAYNDTDVERALEVRKADDEVDALLKEALSNMAGTIEGDDVDGKGFVSYVFIMRALERLGDHITNIAEHIYFIENADYYKK